MLKVVLVKKYEKVRIEPLYTIEWTYNCTQNLCLIFCFADSCGITGLVRIRLNKLSPVGQIYYDYLKLYIVDHSLCEAYGGLRA